MLFRPTIASLVVIVYLAGTLQILPQGGDRNISIATPSVTLPVSPNPADCNVEPRPAESLIAVLGTPPTTQHQREGPQDNEFSAVEIPSGQPASEDIEAAITRTVYELYACFNAGEVRGALALVTDSFLRTFLADGSLTVDDLAFFTGKPEPTPLEARPELLAITDISVLTGGKVGAFVVINNVFTGRDTVYMIFTQHSERWLIDEIIEFLEE